MSGVYGAPIEDLDASIRVAKVRMFEKGHSYNEINSMKITEFTDVLAVWGADAKVQDKKSKKGSK